MIRLFTNRKTLLLVYEFKLLKKERKKERKKNNKRMNKKRTTERKKESEEVGTRAELE